ncbi:MAG TPA: TadE/TadG family type IV pilus assembly protein [Candidatus Solibacter sp.]|jgi:hypothetical protein|nr:TadE/TadG family type IV pilus assembly protein [Candidatus Solibacter sp.]
MPGLLRSIRDRSRSVRGSKSGQAIVEFTLITPVLLLLVLGLTDVARAVYDYNVISNSAREGAREAILSYNACSNTGNVCVGSGPPPGSSLVGVDNAISRAGAGIVSYQFATDGTSSQSSASCTPQPNQGCVWVFIVDGTTTNTPCVPPNPATDSWGICDFNAVKQGGHDVVVEIEFQFQPLTAFVAGALGNSTTLWAKSEMKTEY